MTLIKELGEVVAVPPVILGSGSLEGFPPTLEGGRVEQEESDKIKAREEGDEIGAGLLDADGQRAVWEGRALGPNPLLEMERIGGDAGMAEAFPSGGKGRDVDVAVGAIDTNEGCEGWRRRGSRVHVSVDFVKAGHAGLETATAL